MTWELATLLKIFGGSILAPIVFRILGNVPPRERIYRIMLQYAWTILFAVGVALVWGFTPSYDLLPIVTIGMMMPLAVFFQWRAMAISPSRTGIFMEGTSIIPLLMSAILLGEWKAFEGNGQLIFGFTLVCISVALHAHTNIGNKRKIEETPMPAEGFLKNAMGFMLIFAVATFLENYWAKTGINTPDFLVAWYAGAFTGSVILFMTTRHLPQFPIVRLQTKKEQILIFLAALSIIFSLGLQFVTFTLVEQTVALPVISVGNIIGPTLVGMFIFNEWKTIRGRGWLDIGFGFVGALIMALSH